MCKNEILVIRKKKVVQRIQRRILLLCNRTVAFIKVTIFNVMLMTIKTAENFSEEDQYNRAAAWAKSKSHSSV